jgi:hypothetical protein
LSTVVRQGSSDGAWKAMPEIFSGPVTGSPSIVMRPFVGCFSPVVSFMKVDLPQPEGPTMAMNSPSRPAGRWPRPRTVLGQQLVVVGQPDVVELDEGGRWPCSSGHAQRARTSTGCAREA